MSESVVRPRSMAVRCVVDVEQFMQAQSNQDVSRSLCAADASGTMLHAAYRRATRRITSEDGVKTVAGLEVATLRNETPPGLSGHCLTTA